jgi:hypothetical protein
MQPSAQPSMQPTSVPSSQPTLQPSSRPSMQPSNQPSMQPSSILSSQPSDQPSMQPSMISFFLEHNAHWGRMCLSQLFSPNQILTSSRLSDLDRVRVVELVRGQDRKALKKFKCDWGKTVVKGTFVPMGIMFYKYKYTCSSHAYMIFSSHEHFIISAVSATFGSAISATDISTNISTILPAN